MIEWKRIDNINDLQQCTEKWENLFHLTGCQLFFNHPKVMQTWLDVFWKKTWSLNFLVALEDGEWLAAIPIYIKPGEGMLGMSSAHPIGQGEEEKAEILSEYLDILVAPERKAELLPTIKGFLDSCADILVWRAILFNSDLCSLYPDDENLARGASFRYWISTSGWTPQSLKKNALKQFKRQRNKLTGKNVTFRWASEDEHLHLLDELGRLHTKHWQSLGKQGAFSSEDFLRYHRSLTTVKNQSTFSLLEIDDQIVCVHYYLKDEGTCYFYQSGWNSEKFSNISPGFLLHCWSIENCEKPTYDFMMSTGKDSYKERFNCEKTPMRKLVRLSRFSVKYLLHKTMKRVKKRLMF